jgi:hypothetical protein
MDVTRIGSVLVWRKDDVQLATKKRIERSKPLDEWSLASAAGTTKLPSVNLIEVRDVKHSRHKVKPTIAKHQRSCGQPIQD